jgi:hemerythrin-like metal-binding protein
MDVLNRRKGIEIGIPEMDRQHRSMMDGFEFLRRAPRRHASDVRELHSILGEVQAHFEWEESQMSKTQYPDKARHGVDHALQLSNLRDLLKYVEEGHERLDEDFFLACLGWTDRHIRSLDADFGLFLSDREAWDLQQELKAWEYEERFSEMAD